MTGNAATADRAGKAGRLKRALGAALAILIAVPVLFAAGFLWFVWRMPSEEVELAWQMPDVELIPFPVISEKMRNEPWWTAASMRLLFFEYVKYLVAQVRTRLEPASASTDFAGDRSRTRS